MMQKPSSASYAVPWISAKRQAREQRVHTSARLLLRAVLLALSFFLLVSFLSSRAWADVILTTGSSVQIAPSSVPIGHFDMFADGSRADA